MTYCKCEEGKPDKRCDGSTKCNMFILDEDK